MRILSIVGTRPQLIKAAVVEPALRAKHDATLIDTGQHWSDELAGTFFGELGLARPEHTLATGGGTYAEQTAAMLTALEPILVAEHPDAVIVYGDTNSTLGGALAAAKLGLPVAHIEAGLRSFDRGMPEEVNRVVVDHLSAWLFAPTPTAVQNLAREGIVDGVALSGDVMQDLAAGFVPAIRDPAVLDEVAASLRPGRQGLELRPGRFLFATIHRAENREPAAIRAWTGMLGRLARADRPVILALHPGTLAAVDAAGIRFGPDVVVVEPVGYRTSLALQLYAAAVLTDSGGIQREAAWLGVPCLVLRGSTEWHEAVEGARGTMVLVGLDARRAADELDRLAPPAAAEEASRARAARAAIAPSGAARIIVDALAGGPRPAGTDGGALGAGSRL